MSFALVASTACAGQQPPETAPGYVQPSAQIPVDLDLVLRLDLARLREGVGVPVEQAVRQGWQQTSLDPTGILGHCLSSAQKLWVGLRPSADPLTWDYVLVLEGQFAEVSERRLAEGFRPPRPLVGGYVVYDAWQVPHRISPARLYLYRDSRMIFASAAEVDAIERVIEGGRYERVTEPPARGLLSFQFPAGRLARRWEASSPKLARLMASAGEASGSIDLTARGVTLDARVSFDDPLHAERVAMALRLVAQALAKNASVAESTLVTPSSAQSDSQSTQGPPPALIESSNADVAVSVTFSLETLAQWLSVR